MSKLVLDTTPANKCVIGGGYFLTGMVYRYNFETGDHQPLINQPVTFIGRDKSISNNGKNWFDCQGQFEFKMNDGHKVYMYAKDDVFNTPIEDPEILRNE